MRQILIGDVIAAARSVLNVPRDVRARRLVQLLDQALVADKVTKRTGRPHFAWGNGSLMAACPQRHHKDAPPLAEQAYLEALRDTIDQVILWKQRDSSQTRHHG
ncbi:hypothetical protein SAMN05216227_1006133 [Pseudorhodobacter antarcticus]|jgi:hypothetical protein|uniref:DUF7742 domain-containing protein n=1 Tax=Pseudorhodobacter antarcticus TaxID=1077947 RepID=A0A1H8DAT7_9RHOB|nr:hypothetical protein [Pseudorhodobacter antarcticus]SEN03924.1 hypothetical protein SAMN05216227_1006133 [Pseudorhodobacter antarcticus]